jgi:NO-binding membrane sensor protein with MHYT domain/signal transduction histidine kinase
VYYLEEGTMIQIGAPLAGSYDYGEVARSIIIAIAASYAALDLGGRITAASGGARAAWLTGGAIAMGIGIWAMHFKGMLAFRLPVTVGYYWPTVLASLLIAALASTIALYVATRQRMGPVRAWTGSSIIGGGIAAMHYVGMAAMRLNAVTRFNPLRVALSVVLAILFSRIALMFTFDYHEDFRGTTLSKVVSAAVMGGAISVMHYTGMAAASFVPAAAFPNLSHVVSISPLANNGIAIVTFLVLGTAILTSAVDRQTQVQVLRLNERLEQRVVERTRQLTTANEELRREIAERQRAEEALRSSEQEQHQIAAQLERERGRLVEAQELGKIGSWEAELQSLNVIWSEQTHRIFETDPSHFHPTRPKFREFVRPEDRAKVDAAFVASLDKRSPSTVEYRIVIPDGRVKIIEERWQVFRDEEGKPVRVAGTCRDITERVRAEEKLRRLSGELLRLQDEERRKIARDLHDSAGQDLVALATMLGQLRGSIPPAGRKSRTLLSDCKALADRCIREIRTLSYVLHPPVLEQAGLGDAIRDYVTGFSRRSGIQVELELSPGLGRMAQDVELALFRVVQEALTNIQRHSGSQQARIRIHSDSHLMLEISDPGYGLSDRAQTEKGERWFEVGVGIASMQERVKLTGGRLDIESTTHGTTVRVTIPMERNEREKAAHSGG